MAVSAMCVDRMAIFFPVGGGVGGGIFFFFSSLPMEKDLSAQGRRHVFWKEQLS